MSCALSGDIQLQFSPICLFLSTFGVDDGGAEVAIPSIYLPLF